MEGKINDRGVLCISRGKIEMNGMSCPHKERSSCGCWCALFGEPVKLFQGETELALCSRVLVFKDFIDERKPPVG